MNPWIVLREKFSKKKALNLPVAYQQPLSIVGNQIALYPADSGERYITKGYQLNDAVYSIVSKNAEKAGQVRLYHVKIKKNERKTREEYEQLTKGSINAQVLREAGRMRKAMIEDAAVTSPLQKLLNKPNRNQTQGEFIEEVFGLRELQGEGNIWFPAINENKAPPSEMFPIPKPHIQIVGNADDPWDIVRYQFVLNGKVYQWEKDNVLMWRYSNPIAISSNFEHLRGYAPLASFMIGLQAMNEGDVSVAASNKNRGAYGFAYREDLTSVPTKEQIEHMRAQFDGILYDSDMTGKIGMLGGKWGYHNLGASIEAQKLIEQYGIGFKRLCRVFKTPAGIFSEGNDTYENQRQYERHWIYSKIAPNIYRLRELLSEKLIRAFSMDMESNMIDADMLALPELTQDFKDQSAAYKDAVGLTLNEIRAGMGYEPIQDPNLDKVYVSTNLVPLDQVNAPIGGNLDSELSALNG